MASFVIKYKNRNIEPEIKYFDCSKKLISLYDMVYNDKHIIEVVKTGEVDIYEKIQTYAHDNDLAKLIKNIELTRDSSLYRSKQNGFIDSTVFPTSLNELVNQQKEAELLVKKVMSDEYTQAKGISFKDFIKNYSEKDHYEFLKNKYEKKENN